MTKKLLIFILSTILLYNLGCKKEKFIFNFDEITNIFLIEMEDSGDNVMKYYFTDGKKKIIELLNNRNDGQSSAISSSNEEYEKYFLRIETKNDYYTIGFINQNDFVIKINGNEKKYYIENFINILLDMDSYPSFDNTEIIRVRLFDENLKIKTEIPISNIINLLDALSKMKDVKNPRETFNETPIAIIRIQQAVGGFQLFCGKDSVWISGKYGVYVFKSQQIADNVNAIIKNSRIR